LIRFLNSGGKGAAETLPAPRTFDNPRLQGDVLRAVRRTGFIRRR